MTAVPPTRYRVVERGRRLEVIDTWAGGAARPVQAAAKDDGVPRAASPMLPRAPVRTRFDGGGVLTTHPLYDAKAPRTIALDPGSAAAIGRAKLVAIVAAFAFVVLAVWVPLVLAVPVALAQKGARDRVRGWITQWLDRVEREAS